MKFLVYVSVALPLLCGGVRAQAQPGQPEPPKFAQVGQWRVPSKQPANIYIIKPKAFFRQAKNKIGVPGEIYVRFREGMTPEQRKAVSSRAQTKKVLYTSTLVPGLYRVAVPVGKEGRSIDAFLDSPDVLYAQSAPMKAPTVIPNDAGWSDNGMYGMRRIRMPDAWDVHTGGDFLIGISDSGIDQTHPDLAANLWTNPGEIAGNGIDDDNNGYVDDVHGINTAQSNGNIADATGHGTHVAGTIGAVGNNSVGVVGVNWRCKMVITTGDSVEELNYLVARGVRVSNHSYKFVSAGNNVYNQAMYDALAAAQAVGHIAVCAAGNDGANSDTLAVPPYPASYALDNVISVARHESNQTLASSSNYGATLVDLAAPGGDVLSTVPFPDLFGEKSGTSMSSPHVCGAIGLIWSKFPYIHWRDMRSRILTGVIHENSYEGLLASEGRLDATRSMAVFVRYGGVGLNGTKSSPYININTALPNVPIGGHLMIRATTQNWTGRLDRPMYITSYDGVVVLGRN